MINKKHILIPFLILLCCSQWVYAQELVFTAIQNFEADFNFPTDITGNENGDVFVLDAMNDRVVVIKKNGEVSEIKPQRDTFYKAVGLAFIDGELWIADTPRSRLLKLKMDGRISEVISLGHGTEPVDLVAIGENKIITDRMNHTVTVLDGSHKEKYYWGKRGNAVGEFINPGFLAVGPENRLIIGDILNRRVMSYSQSGRFPTSIVKPGVQRGQIFRPKGVALDSKNRVWVADGYTGAIQAFSVSGKFLGVATVEGQTLGLSAPMGLWVDQKDQLWVVESYSNKVSVWRTQ